MTTRRRFLRVTAGGIACATCPRALAGCGDGDDTPVAPLLENDVVVTLTDHGLEQAGVVVELAQETTGHSYPIFVRNLGADGFRALSSFCNHEECVVISMGEGFSCPCHGAGFDAEGKLTQGPATADLVEFETQSDGVTLTIFSNATAAEDG